MNQTTSTQQLNDVEQQTIDSTLDSAYYDTPTGNSKDNDQLSHIVVFTSVLLIMFLSFRACLGWAVLAATYTSIRLLLFGSRVLFCLKLS